MKKTFDLKLTLNENQIEKLSDSQAKKILGGDDDGGTTRYQYTLRPDGTLVVTRPHSLPITTRH